MAKIFEVDFRTGSLVDRVGGTLSICNNTTSLIKGDKGIGAKINASNDGVTISYPLTILYSEVINFRTGATTGLTLIGASGHGSLFHLWRSGINIYINGGGSSATISGDFIKQYTNYQFIIIRIGTSISVYVNGIAQSVAGSVGVTESMIVNRLGNRSNNDMGTKNTIIYSYTVYDHILTEAERAKAYSDFLNSYPLEAIKSPDYTALKPMDLSREKNNTLGTNLFPNYDFTAGIWIPSNISNRAQNSFTSSTSPGALSIITDVFVIGKKYNCTIKGYKNTTALFTFSSVVYYGYPHSDTYYGTTELSFESSFSFIASGSTGVRLRIQGIDTVTITSFQVQEVTGLVAAYNMIPNGNVLPDISGNNNPGTLIGNPMSIKDGLSFDGIDDYILNNNYFLNAGSVYTVQFRMIAKPTGGVAYVFGNSSSTTQFLYFSGGVQIGHRLSSGGTALLSCNYPINKPFTVTIVRNGTTTEYIYIDSVKYTLTLATNEPWSIRRIGCTGVTVNFGRFDMNMLRVYNRAFTDQEAYNYNNQFAKRVTLREDFSLEGADGIAKVPSGWSKTSGSFKVGEFNPIIGNLSSSFSLDPGWSNLGDGKYLYTSSLTNSYMQKIPITGMSTNKAYKLTYTIFENPGSTILQLYQSLWTDLFSTLNASIGIHTYYSYSPYSANLRFRVLANNPSGLIFGNIILEEIPPLPTFKNGTKYLECVTAGIISIPSKQAYGTWEFDIYKAANSDLFIQPISKTIGTTITAKEGYNIRIDSAEMLYLQRFNLGRTNLFNTVVSYITGNAWYRIKVNRSLAGVFTMYIKGGAFDNTNWTLVSTTGGSGTNPITDNTHTTSEYFVLDLDAEDRITNIQLTEGIEQ